MTNIHTDKWFLLSADSLQKQSAAAFLDGAKITNIENFINIVFPKTGPLGGVGARILESGAVFEKSPKIPWAPRWSKIAMTKKSGSNGDVIAVKEIFYRMHDCFHQLWGIPTPKTFDETERRYYKRCQMAGEVAVLTLTEFCYGLLVKTAFPGLEEIINNRLATPIFPWRSLDRERLQQIAIWLDAELHECNDKSVPKIHENFVQDYRVMLQRDRDMIDVNWQLMKEIKWHPGEKAPKDLLPPGLCGLDLTLWMMDDFVRLLGTSPEVDWPLRHFNIERRQTIFLPDGWAS